MIDLKNKRILVVVAHPDDELLGLGGTINKLVSEFSCNASLLILGEGVTSRSNKRDVGRDSELLLEHHDDTQKAAQTVGYSSVQLSSLPDNRFDSVDLLDIIKIVENAKDKEKPDIVFTHHPGDLNIDHRRTFQAVMTAFRPLPNSNNCSLLLTFETSSGTEWQSTSLDPVFRPNFIVELDESHMDSKICAMNMYRFEKRPWPHPRSSEALRTMAKYNGSSYGFEFAERFQIIRGVFS
jgi:LmbE family N-acetylglucosaminyl deacetylase